MAQAAAAMDRATGGAQKKRPSKTCDDTLGSNASPGAAAGATAAGATEVPVAHLCPHGQSTAICSAANNHLSLQ